MLNEPLEGDGIIAFSYVKSPYNLWDKGSHEGQDSSTATTRLRALPFSSSYFSVLFRALFFLFFPPCLEHFNRNWLWKKQISCFIFVKLNREFHTLKHGYQILWNPEIWLSSICPSRTRKGAALVFGVVPSCSLTAGMGQG